MKDKALRILDSIHTTNARLAVRQAVEKEEVSETPFALVIEMNVGKGGHFLLYDLEEDKLSTSDSLEKIHHILQFQNPGLSIFFRDL